MSLHEADSRELKPQAVRMFRRILTLLISVLVAAILVVLTPGWDVGTVENRLAYSIALIVLLGSLSGARFWLSGVPVEESSNDSPGIDSASESSIYANAAMDAFFRRFTVEEMVFLIRCLIEPVAVNQRISERVSFSHSYYETEITRTILAPSGLSGPPSRVLIPVLSPKKGEMVDSLDILTAGSPVRALSHRETKGAILACAKSLVSTLYTDFALVDDLLWSNICVQLTSAEPATPSERNAIIGRLRQDIGEMGPLDSDRKASAVALSKILEDEFVTYKIIADVPAQDEVVEVITRHNTEVSLSKRDGGNLVYKLWDWSVLQLRSMFGLTSRSHTLHLQNAVSAESFHFHFRVPDELYVYEVSSRVQYQTVEGRLNCAPGEPVEPLLVSPPLTGRAISPMWDAKAAGGRNNVHVYARDLGVWSPPSKAGNVTQRSPWLSIELRERPPGLLFVVLLIAAFLAGIVAVVGLWHNYVFGLQDMPNWCYDGIPDENGSADVCKPIPGSSWPTLLLGIPAIVAGVIATRFTAKGVRSLSLSTIAVTIWCIANAVVAVVLSALKQTLILDQRAEFLGFVTVQPLWLILLFSSIACFVISVLLLLFRIHRYNRRMPLGAKRVANQKISTGVNG